jgi:hypothetical protein
MCSSLAKSSVSKMTRLAKLVTAKTLSFAIVCFCVLYVAFFYYGEILESRRVAVLSAEETVVELRLDQFPPYNLLIAVPGNAEKPPPFDGLLELVDSKGNKFKFPIDSERSVKSSWVRDPLTTGYILGWGRSEAVPIGEVLKCGENFQLRVTFKNGPPPGSSLWLSYFRHLTLLGDKAAEQAAP